MSNSANRENIKVICRLRPLNQKEKDLGCGLCMTNNKDSVKVGIGEEANHDYTFDRVFGPESDQSEVFDYVAKPIIEGAMEGWNGTLFCYGQTSSGKTHTMEGVHDIPDLRGIIPRMMEYVFDLIRNASVECEFTVKCSSLEIYNEKIQDLLDPRKNNLMVKEEKGKGIWVDDATEIYLSSKEEMYDVFKIGSDNRRVGSTSMNAKSSRSHSLFIVTIFQKNNKTDSTKTGKIYFVDLAGSEKMSKTGIEGGQMLEEAKNINKSLLNLGMVINSLTENRSHVPYRDSKLTRVLQESLGGNSHTTLVINCSMSSYNDKESLSTLRFGQRAKAIKNKVVLNTERSAKELLLKLAEADEKIKYYQNIISQMQTGGDTKFLNTITNQNNTAISYNLKENGLITKASKSCDDCSNAMRKLLNQHIELVTAQEELERVKEDKLELEEEITARNSELYELNERALLSELKIKLFIEEELKTFGELQFRLEHIFLLNQNKLLETNKIRNILEKTRYEIIILMKSNKLKLDKVQTEASNEEFTKYHRNLDESLTILNRIEEYIISDNKNFNDLVDFISGKNLENDNLPSYTGNNINMNMSSNTNNTINNISLNINKNININIIKKTKNDRVKRRNSVSFSKRKMNLANGHKFNKSCIPANQSLRNSINVSSVSANIKTIKGCDANETEENISFANNSKEFLYNEDEHDDNLTPHNYSIENEEVNNFINPNYKSRNINQILQIQRKTITDLAFQFKTVKDTLSNVEKENNEKDLILNKNTEKNVKTETKIKVYEEIINELNEKIMVKQEEFDIYKTKSIMDFEYKEMKIVNLVTKIADLEDENYKLVHFSKDKDKKKFHIMEKQIKEFTIEMPKLISDNSKLKSTIDKKEEETRNLYIKISELENRLVQTVRNKMNEVSFAGNGPELNSGICTPITSYLNVKGFHSSSLSEILTAKLKNLKSISPQSNDGHRSSGSSNNYNSIVSKGRDSFANNNRPNYNSNQNNFGSNTREFNLYNPNTISPTNKDPNSQHNNIMRVIRGGGGKDNNYNSNQNFFFNKMPSNGSISNTGSYGNNDLNSIQKLKSVGKKINIDKLRKEKYEQEMKYLDNEDLNNSKESEILEAANINQKRSKTPQRDKGGFFNFFSKIISK